MERVCELKEKVLAGGEITRQEALELAQAPYDALCAAADEIRKAKCGNGFDLCTIINEGKRLDNGKLLATLTEYYNRKPGYRVCSQTPTMTGATTWFNICSIFF